MDGRSRFEVVIVGAGIAGASLAYFLAESGLTDVLLLEREDQLAYHSTGRSAAVLSELDPVAALRQLKTLAAPFLREPPAGFAEHPLLARSGVMAVFAGAAWDAFQQAAPVLEADGMRLALLGRTEVLARVPVLAADQVDGAVLLPDDGHIDVHELLSAYLRHARARGAALRLGAEVIGLRVDGGRCTGVVTRGGEYRAALVVNAAGAWAGEVARAAGAIPIPLVPHRRTIVTFAPPAGIDVRAWPFVICDGHGVYFAPESGGVKLSPMDEDPMPPCDARPDEVVIATALERLGVIAPALVPRALGRCWAGLRSFVPDRLHVVGADPRLPGLFWLAGQGGCGIETSPIIGRLAADLILHGTTTRFDADLLSPARFV
ncbi:MAG: FAD-binding oxidoreductase [Candidatus Binatia bacterium]